MTLDQAQERYWEAFRAKERAFYESQSAFRDWDEALTKYESARSALAEAGADLEQAAREPA